MKKVFADTSYWIALANPHDSLHTIAKVYTINGLSSHAGQDELLDWHKNIGKPESTFLVHGAPEAMANIAGKLKARGNSIKIPTLHQAFNL